jgi:hypothetical protein
MFRFPALDGCGNFCDEREPEGQLAGKSKNSRAPRRNKEPIKVHSRLVNSKLIRFSGGISSRTGV